MIYEERYVTGSFNGMVISFPLTDHFKNSNPTQSVRSIIINVPTYNSDLYLNLNRRTSNASGKSLRARSIIVFRS